MNTTLRTLPTIVVLLGVFFLQAPPAFAKPGMRLSSQGQALRFHGKKPLEVWVEVQLVVVKTKEKAPRLGPLYLTSDYDGIVFPSGARLDARGFARLKLVIAPPGLAEHRRLRGRFTVWILIDEEDADDTIEGRLVFTYRVGGG